MRRGIYQGWLGCRNLGDEAIFQACVRSLPRIRWAALPFDEIGRRRVSPAAVWNAWTRHTLSLGSASLAIFGGGTVINRTPAWLDQYRRLQRAARGPVPVFSPGVADPAFWSEVPGWRDTRGGWREAMSALPEIGVRGPRSKRLLEEAGVRNVIVAGDPALSFHGGLRSVPAPGRRAVAVNVGRTGGLMWGSEDRAINAMTDAVRRLSGAGFNIRFFPMWHGDGAVCREVARAAALPDAVVDPLILEADRFLAYLDQFDVVASVKLHAAVLAAAAGVPFVAVEYQPKVRDFTESVGWTRFSYRSDAIRGRDIERAVRVLYDDLPAFRQALDARVGELALTFRAYAGRLEEFLLES
jgi:polysaccharide pyruvyl transferase WcaK-like protein